MCCSSVVMLDYLRQCIDLYKTDALMIRHLCNRVNSDAVDNYASVCMRTGSVFVCVCVCITAVTAQRLKCKCN